VEHCLKSGIRMGHARIIFDPTHPEVEQRQLPRRLNYGLVSRDHETQWRTGRPRKTISSPPRGDAPHPCLTWPFQLQVSFASLAQRPNRYKQPHGTKKNLWTIEAEDCDDTRADHVRLSADLFRRSRNITNIGVRRHRPTHAVFRRWLSL
jgi:hypothetical protein